MCCRSLRRQRKQEYYERERKKERERNLREQEEIFLAEKKKILEASANEGKNEGLIEKIKETIFEEPTVEEIKQLEQEPKPLVQKKIE